MPDGVATQRYSEHVVRGQARRLSGGVQYPGRAADGVRHQRGRRRRHHRFGSRARPHGPGVLAVGLQPLASHHAARPVWTKSGHGVNTAWTTAARRAWQRRNHGHAKPTTRRDADMARIGHWGGMSFYFGLEEYDRRRHRLPAVSTIDETGTSATAAGPVRHDQGQYTRT